MDIKNLLFGFDGRIRRLHYWLAAIGSSVAFGVVYVILTMVFFGAAMMASQAGAGHASGGGLVMALLGGALMLALAGVMIWIGLALQIKRWHDRDKPAIWVLINLIPFVGGVWTLVECGFLDGTPGPNRFGLSPKGLEGPEPVPATP